MARVFLAGAFAFHFFVASMALSDRIIFRDGKERPVTGKILAISAENVTVEVRGERREIAAPKISATEFDGEPGAIKIARGAFAARRFAEVLERLEKLDAVTLSTLFMQQEFAYFRVAAKTHLNDAAAFKELEDFVQNHKNSYHYFEICELCGDLATKQGRTKDAKKTYTLLLAAPWPEPQQRARVALGMIELTHNDIQKARQYFESVKNEQSESQANSSGGKSLVGLALCLAAEEKFEEAILELEKLAETKDDAIFSAFVYDSLGSVYERANKPNEAILAYMHTDILFSAAQEEHMRALTALSKLWRQVNKPERAADAEKRLKELYGLECKE